MSRARVVSLREAERLELAAGVTMQPHLGEGAMLNLLEFDSGTVVPVHAHPDEQLGPVLEGRLALTVDGVEHLLGPGDAYQIPDGVEHAARSDGRCLVLDVFQPAREDYRERARR